MVNVEELVEESLESNPPIETRIKDSDKIMAENVVNSRHPYYIKSCEHSGMKITSVVLTGIENFLQWKREVTVALSTRNKLGFVYGTVEEPSVESELWFDYNCCKQTVASWICNSLSSEITRTVLFLTEPKELWDTLNVRFSERNATRKFQLKSELNHTKQGALTVSEYYAKQKELRDAVKSLCATRKCNCSNVCHKHLDDQQEEDENDVMLFLMGLNPQYQHIRSNVLMTKPLPKLEEVFAMVVQEESQRNLSNHIEAEATALYSKPTYQSKKNGNVECSYCKKMGHTKYQCYKLVGYPEGHKFYKPPTEQQLANRKKFSQ